MVKNHPNQKQLSKAKILINLKISNNTHNPLIPQLLTNPSIIIMNFQMVEKHPKSKRALRRKPFMFFNL